MSAQEILKVERRCSLFLSFTFSAIAFSVGLTALLKADQERSYINQLIVPHGMIDIGMPDVFAMGTVIIAICGLLTVISGLFCALTWCPKKRKPSFLRIQSWALFFCAGWLLSTMVTYDYFFATQSAQIIINLHGNLVRKPVVQRYANLLGFTDAYRDVYFLKVLTVIPWFAAILAAVAAVVLHLTARRTDAEQGEKNGCAGPGINVTHRPPSSR